LIPTLKNFFVESELVVEGLRSDYYIAFALDHSWDDAIEIIRKRIDEFMSSPHYRGCVVYTKLSL
jgi:hypothetical protein